MDNLYVDPEVYPPDEAENGLVSFSPLFRSGAEVKEVVHPTGPGVSAVPLSSKAVYGITADMVIATAPGGYHSKPHLHNCEQYIYTQKGSIWMFIEKKAYHLEEGISSGYRRTPSTGHGTKEKRRASFSKFILRECRTTRFSHTLSPCST